jgi:hypothetical protein
VPFPWLAANFAYAGSIELHSAITEPYFLPLFTNLRVVTIRSTQITDLSVKELARCPHLQSVNLTKCEQVTAFDAYGFLDKIFLYAEGLEGFLSRGGILAWGIVPTTDTERKETAEDLVIRIDSAFNRLASLGIDRNLVFSRSLITPSCGMGLSEIDTSVHRLELASKVSSILRGKNSVI